MSPPAEFFAAYDLRERGVWQRANRHRSYWGRLYVDADIVGDDYLLLTFRPSPDARWRPWEAVRKNWILRDAA